MFHRVEKRIKNFLKSPLKKQRKLGLLLIIFSIFAVLYFAILKDLPSPTRLSSSAIAQSTQILDRNGKHLYTIYGEENRTSIPLSEIPDHVEHATIAIEDKDFYFHGALDFKAIVRAFIANVFHNRVEGGSTITQQLIKNSLLTPERTITRKIREAILAFATEAIYPKQAILEMYLNQIPYGGTASGIEAASLTFFGKHAKDLTLAESALLAGLPEATTTYSPFGSHPELAKRRQEEVLRKMQEQGYITKQEEEKAKKERLVYKNISNDIKAPHFVFYVRDLLIERYGEKVVAEGGLQVKTSLDLDIQEMAQASVSAEVAKIAGYRVSNGAALVTNPATGEILAMVGSKNYFDDSIDGNVNVTIAKRQPGSSIKPINYAVGLIKGYTAATPFIDKKICFPNQGGKSYCPVNYDGKFHGVVTMREALGNSLNIPAVKMLKLNGIDAMMATASAMGISTWDDPSRYGLSLTLGGGEVMMTEMATAFGTFANEGYKVDLQPILEVKNSKGKVIEKYDAPLSPVLGKKVLPEGVAFIISDILRDNNARLMAFGPRSELYFGESPVSVKTGTTNDYKDNWTIGFTQDTLVTVWVGNNDNTPMSGVVSGVTGAAPIFHDIMAELLKTRPGQEATKPPSVITRSVCAGTGSFSIEGVECKGRTEYFIIGSEPKKALVSKKNVWVDKSTNEQPPEGKTDNLELKEQTVIIDATGDEYCITCAHPSPSP
jgi:penicillin-binding protein 1C